MVNSALVRAISRHETFFTDYSRVCEASCFRYDCDLCASRLRTVSRHLVNADSIIWEVWSVEAVPRLCGIVYLTQVIPGCDAVAHYLFFDGNLRDKTTFLEAMIEWCFTEHPGWLPLRRLTITVPAYASALASHANRRLGFGGPFRYRRLDKPTHFLKVEGAKEKTIRWRGEDHDLLILGRLR